MCLWLPGGVPLLAGLPGSRFHFWQEVSIRSEPEGRGLHLLSCALLAAWEAPEASQHALGMFSSLRRAKQLSLVQEDGSNRAVNSGTPCETEDEVSLGM